MRKRRPSDLVVLSSKMDSKLAQRVKDAAEELGQSTSETIWRLLEKSLDDGTGDEVAEDLESRGFQAGLRRGLHEVRTHMRKLYGRELGKELDT